MHRDDSWGDLQNLLEATEIAVLFLDRALRILRFTPKAGEILHIRPADCSRPLSDVTHRLGYEGLAADAEAVLRTLVPVEREVTDEAGRWYLTRVLPHRSAEDRVEGVALTFVDITAWKQTEEALREASEYAEKIVETLHDPLLVLTPDLRVRSVNPAFYDHFGVRPEATIGRLVYELGNGQWDIPALRTLLEDILPDSNVFNDYEVRHDFEDLGERVMLVNARRLDHVQLILLGIRDVTERQRAEDELRRLNDTLEARADERAEQVRELAATLAVAEQDERQRIAHILHDDLQQLLFALSTTLHLIRSARSDEEARDLHDQAAEILEEAAELTRSLSVEMSPPVLASSHLDEILTWVAARKEKRYGLEVAVDVEARCEIPLYATRVLLYRTLLEVLFNVVKHAGTRQARMRARAEDGAVVVEVEDEGVGFDVRRLEDPGSPDRGFGLHHVRERLALAGGRFEIVSVPGQGTRVTITVPIAPPGPWAP